MAERTDRAPLSVRIVINHLTRMSGERICVAGIDPRTLKHIRPVTPPDDLMTRRMLRSNGGPFGIGAVIEMGALRACPSPPETEDHRYATSQASWREDLDGDAYLDLLERVSDTDAATAFGSSLQEIRPSKFAVPAGRGDRSLAVVPASGARLSIEFKKLYLHLGPATLRVTDVRFYRPDLTVRGTVVKDVNRRLRLGTPAYAMLGLARAIDDEAAGLVHWLMANGICLADHPARETP